MNADGVLKKILSGRISKAGIAKAASECPPEDLLDTIFIHCDIADLTSDQESLNIYISALADISKSFKKHDLKHRADFRIAENFEDMGNPKKALSIYGSCLKESTVNEDSFYQGQSLSRLGHLFKRNMSQPPILKKHKKASQRFESLQAYMAHEAAEYFQKAADTFKAIGHDYNHSVSVFNKALLLYSQGFSEESYSLTAEARIIAEKGGFGPLIAECMLHIANIYCDRKEYYNAKIYYRTAADFFIADGNRLKASDVLHKLGWIIAIEQDTEAAASFYEKALSLKKSVDFVQSLGDCFLKKGTVYYYAGSFIKAEGLFANAASCFDFCRMSGNELISKYFLYKASVKGTKNFSQMSLCEFIKSYRTRKHKAPQSVSEYKKIIPDIRRMPHAYGMPEDIFAIERKKLAGLVMDLGTLKWMTGDRAFSSLCASCAAILKNFNK